VGTIKSVGRIYQQTFLDTYAKVAFAKLHDRKNALVAADLLNDRVLPVSPHKSSPGSSLAISPYPASWREPTSRMRLHHTFATHLEVLQISA
jgi:hypothetical protein